MALVLTGVVRGMRPVGGVVEEGPRSGEVWHFLSMEITDPRFGNVYSCQLRSTDKQYKEMVEVAKGTDRNGQSADKHVLKQGSDLTGHKVKVLMSSVTAGERKVQDKDTNTETTILQVRCQITRIQDLGEPGDDE